MNYLAIYNNLCEKSKGRIYDKKVHHKHHIIPRCMGGNDDKDNLAILSRREHFVAHKLLIEIYPENNKLRFAFRLMIGEMIKYGEHFSSRDYERAMCPIKHSLESRKLMSEKKRGERKSKESIEKGKATRKRNAIAQVAEHQSFKLGVRISIIRGITEEDMVQVQEGFYKKS